jgi:hypothetical protein
MKSLQKEDIKNNVLIVTINRTYEKSKDVYECTRKSWRLNAEKLKDIELVISEYKQEFIRVYKPLKWFPTVDEKGKKRWMFEGEDVSAQYPQYINKKNGFKKIGEANPVRVIFGEGKHEIFTKRGF